MTISEEAVADAPTLWNFVQGRLLQGVQRQEEVQILAGPGMPGVGGLLSTFASSFTVSSSSSLFGATSATGTNVAFPPSGTAGTGAVAATIASLAYGRKVSGTGGNYPSAVQVAENLHDAFVDIQLQVFKTPNAIVMHPRDWLQLRIAKDAQGQYFNSSFFGTDYGVAQASIGGNAGAMPVGGGGKSLWGVPVVTTPLMPRYTILTGWFDPSTIQVARRKGVTMQMTNTNGTDFVQGQLTARAESRLGLLVYRPPAFQLIQLATGT
jgi:HK97 family phage major capsid protein